MKLQLSRLWGIEKGYMTSCSNGMVQWEIKKTKKTWKIEKFYGNTQVKPIVTDGVKTLKEVKELILNEIQSYNKKTRKELVELYKK